MEISLPAAPPSSPAASKGIGFAVATRFARPAPTSRSSRAAQESLDEAVERSRPPTRRVSALQADVGKRSRHARAYDEAMAAFGKVDIMVNNAGTSRAGRSRR